MAERGVVKMQALGGPPTDARKLTVPAKIAVHIPDGTVFRPELTEDGLLYRPVEVPPAAPVPAWTQGGNIVDNPTKE